MCSYPGLVWYFFIMVMNSIFIDDLFMDQVSNYIIGKLRKL